MNLLTKIIKKIKSWLHPIDYVERQGAKRIEITKSDIEKMNQMIEGDIEFDQKALDRVWKAIWEKPEWNINQGLRGSCDNCGRSGLLNNEYFCKRCFDKRQTAH